MTEENTGQAQTAHLTQTTGQPRVVAGRYRLLAELGRGGMGVVWRAEDTVIGRHVAVKELVLPEGAEEQPGVFQERVLREVRTGGKLNDPAVVTVYDVIGEGATTYIVMELVEAPTLSQLIRQHGPLPEHQVASIGEQVLSALNAAHQAGIVHRDVKPGNIMVSSNGRVKLTDFGIAQAVDDPRLTTSGMLVGSPAFMAPERVAGLEALPASDLWSLGAALFFAVEGSVAFERPTTAATLHAIMHEVPYLTRAHGPLASAIMGLLISSPEARISALQAGELLGMAARQQAMLAPTPPGGAATMAYGAQPPTMLGVPGQYGGGPSGPVAKPNPAKRKLAIVGTAIAAVALLLGGFFLGKPFWEPATDEAMLPTLTYGRDGDIPSISNDSSDYCLNTPLQAGRSIAKSNWVDCETEPHDAQHIWSSTVVGGDSTSSDDTELASYPGDEYLARLGESKCAAVFHSNRIDDDERAGLKYQAVVPTRGEWEEYVNLNQGERPERSYHCFVMAADGGRLSGSVTQSVI